MLHITDARTNFLRTLSKIFAAAHQVSWERGAGVSPDRAAHYTSLVRNVNTRKPGNLPLSYPKPAVQRRRGVPLSRGRAL